MNRIYSRSWKISSELDPSTLQGTMSGGIIASFRALLPSVTDGTKVTINNITNHGGLGASPGSRFRKSGKLR